MANYPDDLHYTKDHEWLRVKGDTGTMGITEFAQQQLGDVVFLELPRVNDSFEAGDSIGSVESVKAVSEIYLPVSGTVVAVNEKLADEPELVNTDPYGDGWMVEVKLSNAAQVDRLLTASEYEDYVKSEKEE